MNRQQHDLGVTYVRHENGANFEYWEAETWDCPNCNSRLLAVYVERMGQSCSETDFVECPHCGDKSHRIYSATWPSVKVLAAGNERLTEKEANRIQYGEEA